MSLPSPYLSSHSAVNLSAEEIFLQLSNPGSVWYHLRLAVMAGCDYLFVPEGQAHVLQCLQDYQRFVFSAQNLTGSAATRVVAVKYWHDEHQILRFEVHRLEWAGSEIIGWSKTALEESPQLDFITTLFEHSEPLIVT